MDVYRHYDTSGGYGKRSEWVAKFFERIGIEAAKVAVGVDDPLAILGLQVGATWQQVKDAYGVMAKKWHPDLSMEEGTAEIRCSMMKRVNAAFEILEARYGH